MAARIASAIWLYLVTRNISEVCGIFITPLATPLPPELSSNVDVQRIPDTPSQMSFQGGRFKMTRVQQARPRMLQKAAISVPLTYRLQN